MEVLEVEHAARMARRRGIGGEDDVRRHLERDPREVAREVRHPVAGGESDRARLRRDGIVRQVDREGDAHLLDPGVGEPAAHETVEHVPPGRRAHGARVKQETHGLALREVPA